LELLATIVPNVSRAGLLGNPDTETYFSVLKNAQDAAQKVGLSVVPIEARNAREIEEAFVAFAKERVPAVMVAVDAVFFGQRWQIAELALANRLATMFALREYVEAGGLMSYGENVSDFFRRAASFVGKILKGAKPGDLPIEQPTKFNLVINRKTADTLGVAIPPQLYIFADSIAKAGKRSRYPSAKRNSKRTLLPSTYPSRRMPSRKLARSRSSACAVPAHRIPIKGICRCCACAASGHAAAAPPSSMMNWRRFIFAVIR
jgi:ABC transporter substrate binding protein